LSLAVGCLGILPELWKVMRQSLDTRTLLFADLSPIILALLLILLLSGIQCPQFVVPVSFEGIGYQPIRRIYVKITSLSEIGLIAGALHLFLAQTIHLIQSGLHFLLDGER